MTKNKIKAIEKYGGVYIDRFLKQQKADREIIINDWHKALDFFFSKSFMRGRNDELSERFWVATMKVLDEHKIRTNYNRSELEVQLKAGGVNNKKDIHMVLGTLDFIFNSLSHFNNNIVRYAINEIKSGKLRETYTELDKIPEVGDKIASFFLRDVIMIYELESFLTDDDFQFCQPVDTWVEQVALKIGIIVTRHNDRRIIKSTIIKNCLDAGSSPLLFNAGAWMVGARSFELLIEKL